MKKPSSGGLSLDIPLDAYVIIVQRKEIIVQILWFKIRLLYK
jgi:hypothetical protein